MYYLYSNSSNSRTIVLIQEDRLTEVTLAVDLEAFQEVDKLLPLGMAPAAHFEVVPVAMPAAVQLVALREADLVARQEVGLVVRRTVGLAALLVVPLEAHSTVM